MARCSCGVENVDAGCTTAPKLCWSCCTTLSTVLTCLFHFNQLGTSDRALRLTSSFVTQQVKQQEAARHGVASIPVPAAVPPQQAAQPAQLLPASDLTAVLAQLAIMTAAIQAQSLRLAGIEAAQSIALPPQLSPALAAPPQAPAPDVQQPLPAFQSLPPPAPTPVHRQRALGMAVSPAALNNLFDALEVDSDEDDGKHPDRAEVSIQRTQPKPHLHSPTAPSSRHRWPHLQSVARRTAHSSWRAC
jgi:hypothetical protein